jgi:cellulose synthase/poly-beta-1,6-N-acetylglucosamine synthase-like glycosyltransferase
VAGVPRVGVVVPARDEEDGIGVCLEALELAAIGHRARVVVVLDDCRDGTEEVCRRFGVETLRVSFRNVGRARRAGVAHLLATSRPPGLWLAHTDGDSRVAPDWLDRQADLASCGADAVLGVVRLGPAEAPLYAHHQVVYRRRIHRDGSHDHVHGASMGLTAEAYRATGGFPPLAVHEDRHLALRLSAMRELTVVRTDQVWVETSTRRQGRCQEGFSTDLTASLSA